MDSTRCNAARIVRNNQRALRRMLCTGAMRFAYCTLHEFIVNRRFPLCAASISRPQAEI